ncbi:Fur family transcriptional regulator [Streptomyces sp. SDT5-1]|uniref:Fur family transcriptional regulator n=1 Tax=Streptomyces sp. SDT5-1 TaxID=3406418 RepID=UPI003FD614F1
MGEDAGELLRRRGLRSTAQRRAVLTALRGRPHASAAEIERRIEASRPEGAADGLSRQGLYNVLEDLTRVHLVRCIEPAGSPARFELRAGDNHHHLVCRSCGRIEDVDCAIGAAPCLEPVRDSGFTVDEAEVTWWGQCADCRTAADHGA